MKDIQTENKELETKNKELQVKLDTLSKQPSFIGLAYKTDSKDLTKIINHLKNIFAEIQLQSCLKLRESFLEQKKLLIQSLEEEIRNAPPEDCSKIIPSLQESIKKFAEEISIMIGTEIPYAKIEVIEKEFVIMLTTFITHVCTKDKIDVKKVDQFLLDVFSAICYK